MAELHEHHYKTREDLAEALASGIAAVLAGGIATRGSASLAVSGGSTPGLLFDHLSEADIEWSAVTVTLVDERYVPEDNPRSNAAMVRERLLTHRASTAEFVPHFRANVTPETAAEEVDRAIERVRALDAVVLGMGTDGHTASFFPDGDNYDAATNAETDERVLPIYVPSQGNGGEQRTTLTLPTLVRARFLALHIEGEEKRNVLERAKGGENLPITRVLDAASELEVFWTA